MEPLNLPPACRAFFDAPPLHDRPDQRHPFLQRGELVVPVEGHPVPDTDLDKVLERNGEAADGFREISRNVMETPPGQVR
jgi:hypothetical protein